MKIIDINIVQNNIIFNQCAIKIMYFIFVNNNIFDLCTIKIDFIILINIISNLCVMNFIDIIKKT